MSINSQRFSGAGLQASTASSRLSAALCPRSFIRRSDLPSSDISIQPVRQSRNKSSNIPGGLQSQARILTVPERSPPRTKGAHGIAYPSQYCKRLLRSPLFYSLNIRSLHFHSLPAPPQCPSPLLSSAEFHTQSTEGGTECRCRSQFFHVHLSLALHNTRERLSSCCSLIIDSFDQNMHHHPLSLDWLIAGILP
jgi:hypothetical protein